MRGGRGIGGRKENGSVVGSASEVGPWVFAQVGGAGVLKASAVVSGGAEEGKRRVGHGLGMDEIVKHVEEALQRAGVIPSAALAAGGAVESSAACSSHDHSHGHQHAHEHEHKHEHSHDHA